MNFIRQLFGSWNSVLIAWYYIIPVEVEIIQYVYIFDWIWFATKNVEYTLNIDHYLVF